MPNIMSLCTANWTSGPIATVDEHKPHFGGRCLLRMHISTKPAVVFFRPDNAPRAVAASVVPSPPYPFEPKVLFDLADSVDVVTLVPPTVCPGTKVSEGPMRHRYPSCERKSHLQQR